MTAIKIMVIEMGLSFSKAKCYKIGLLEMVLSNKMMVVRGANVHFS